MKKNIFEWRECIIATLHKKEEIIQPLLEQHLWIKWKVSAINTDTFGTFTREVKRKWDMLQAARAKIFLALKETGWDLWVASEGSFWMHYGLPFVQSNFEIVVFYDKKNDIEIVWHFLSPNTNLNWEKISSSEDGKIFAQKIWFPSHGVILRISEKLNFFIYKDFHTFEELDEKMKQLFSIPFLKNIYIETDMRAHKNPTRMQNIKCAVKNLIKNAQSTCEKCGMPWFVVTHTEGWLECSECLAPTHIPKYEVFTCKKCDFQKKQLITQYWKYANVSECSICNP